MINFQDVDLTEWTGEIEIKSTNDIQDDMQDKMDQYKDENL